MRCRCDTGDTGFLLFLGVPFPKNFQQVCKKILSRLFRVFVHVYIHHFDMICSMGAEAHINTCYKHYYFFISEFSLIDHSELEPLVRERRFHYCYRAEGHDCYELTLNVGIINIIIHKIIKDGSGDQCWRIQVMRVM